MESISITKDKLNEIIDNTLNYWKVNSVVNEWDCYKQIKGYGSLKYTYQMDITPKGNLSFILYNFLGLFHGHYLINVNPQTFEYAIRKDSEYFNFISTSPSDDSTIYTKDMLTKEQQIEIEGHIANSLRFVFYGDFGKFNRNCFIHDVNWQKFIYKKVCEDLL